LITKLYSQLLIKFGMDFSEDDISEDLFYFIIYPMICNLCHNYFYFYFHLYQINLLLRLAASHKKYMNHNIWPQAKNMKTWIWRAPHYQWEPHWHILSI